MLRSRSFHTENITVEFTLFPTYTILNENKNVIGRKAMTFEKQKFPVKCYLSNHHYISAKILLNPTPHIFCSSVNTMNTKHLEPTVSSNKPGQNTQCIVQFPKCKSVGGRRAIANLL